MAYMMSIGNHVATNTETQRMYNRCALEKEFIKLIYMNPLIVLYLIVFMSFDLAHQRYMILWINILWINDCIFIRTHIFNYEIFIIS